MSLPTGNVKIGEVRVDPADGLEYRFDGTSWILEGSGTPSAAGWPTANVALYEVRTDVASGRDYRFNGTSWVLIENKIVAADLADGSVTTSKIADNAITADKIATGAVGASEIDSGAVGSDEIAADAVGSSEIAAGAVGSDEILDGSILAADLASTAPTLVSAERLSNTTLRITLSEDVDLDSATKANDGGFTVEETGTPATSYAVSAIARGADHSTIELTVADVIASAAIGLTVKYATGGNGTVADTTLVPLATDATGVVIPSWA